MQHPPPKFLCSKMVGKYFIKKNKWFLLVQNFSSPYSSVNDELREWVANGFTLPKLPWLQKSRKCHTSSCRLKFYGINFRSMVLTAGLQASVSLITMYPGNMSGEILGADGSFSKCRVGKTKFVWYFFFYFTAHWLSNIEQSIRISLRLNFLISKREVIIFTWLGH